MRTISEYRAIRSVNRCNPVFTDPLTVFGRRTRQSKVVDLRYR
ncbi:hypothetical protein Pd630_LPD06643 [Rhodococcus opacus PD630]|nr:hypothetical protein Pd630_LPD06643 [Rhodococcus opacus PD630]